MNKDLRYIASEALVESELLTIIVFLEQIVDRCNSFEEFKECIKATKDNFVKECKCCKGE